MGIRYIDREAFWAMSHSYAESNEVSLMSLILRWTLRQAPYVYLFMCLLYSSEKCRSRDLHLLDSKLCYLLTAIESISKCERAATARVACRLKVVLRRDIHYFLRYKNTTCFTSFGKSRVVWRRSHGGITSSLVDTMFDLQLWHMCRPNLLLGSFTRAVPHVLNIHSKPT